MCVCPSLPRPGLGNCTQGYIGRLSSLKAGVCPCSYPNCLLAPSRNPLRLRPPPASCSTQPPPTTNSCHGSSFATGAALPSRGGQVGYQVGGWWLGVPLPVWKPSLSPISVPRVLSLGLGGWGSLQWASRPSCYVRTCLSPQPVRSIILVEPTNVGMRPMHHELAQGPTLHEPTIGQVQPFGAKCIHDPLCPARIECSLAQHLGREGASRAGVSHVWADPRHYNPYLPGHWMGVAERRLGILGKGFRPQSDLGDIWPQVPAESLAPPALQHRASRADREQSICSAWAQPQV